MANQEQVDLIKQDIDAWNAWRRERSDIRPDLSGARFSEAWLFDADLSGADLSGANLSDANLSGANLSHVRLFDADLSGADLSRANLSDTNLSRANLSRANLFGADLSEANLSRANLSRANLSKADLSKADLSKADLSKADLSRADLSRANLSKADLSRADLSGANLSGADLSGANLFGARLSDANFTEVMIAYTIFAWVDLCHVNGLETVVHRGASIVDVGTVMLPQGDTRVHFLREVGFSDTFIDYLPSLLTMPLQYHSLFLSYAHPDEALARRLYRDRQNEGVRCWMAPHDLHPGDYHHSRIDEAIHLHEKTLLLLSEHAVNSSWVKHEVQVALAREIAQDCTVLFPLRLDEAVMQTSKDWAVRLRATRHISDWTFWQDEAAYQQAFRTLLHHLKVVKPSPR